MSEPTETTEPIKAARNLREIKRLYRELGSQIIADGISRDIADSNALNFLGPAAKDSQWEAAYDAAEAWADVRDETFVDYAGDQLGENHPLGVLTYWEDLVRMERDQPTNLKATVNRAADYLRDRLDWMFGETEGEANFLGCMQFAADLKQCRAALENVLKDGYRAQRIRAECKSCEDAPRLCLRQGEAKDGSQDHWYCPNCYHLYDAHGVARCWRQMFVKRDAAPEWVPLRAAASATGRPVSTVKTWVLSPDRGDGFPKRLADGLPIPPLVESEMRDDGLRWVRWADVRAADDTTRRRGLNRLVA